MRQRFTSYGATVLCLGVSAAACDRGRDLDLPPAIPVDVPAGAGAALPHLDGAGGDAILSWVEPAGAGHQLRFARWTGTAWSAPRTVAEGADWFVNWADFPSVVWLEEGQLAAHWLQRSGAGTYAYDVMLSRSADDGATWSGPLRPHADGTPTEHGFASLFPLQRALAVVWLDGRKFADAGGNPATNEMTLRYTTFDDGGQAAEQVLDERVCDCCQTAAAMTARGPLIAYRDRSPDEVRDISITRLVDGAWTEPRTLHDDNWVINACPVNGPQVDARGDAVVIAWFTAARDTPRVNVAFSDDAGAAFGGPVRVDGGNPSGRVDVLMLDEDRALVVWLERVADGAEVRGRIVTADGRAGEPASIARTLAQRPSGFPRMTRYDGGVLLAWTQPGDSSRVRAAALQLPTR